MQLFAQLLLPVYLLFASPPAAGQEPPSELDEDLRASLTLALEAAVDEPTPVARRGAAKKLAKRRDVEIEDWLVLMRAFGRFESVPVARVHPHTVSLRVGKDVEETELFVYVPSGYNPTTPAPLMMVYHGTGGSGRGLHRMWEETAEELGMLVLAPSEAGPNDGYHFSERERLSALAALRWTRRRFNVDENRVYASGISRGGHLAWDLALRYPDQLAAIAPMIGGPRVNLSRKQNNLRYLENVRLLPIRDLQGAQDDPGLVTNLRLAFAQLAAWQAPDAKLVEFEDLGHWFRFEAVDWIDFLGSARRNPVCERIIKRSAAPEETRAYWVDVTRLHRDVSEKVRPKVAQAKWNALDEDGRRSFLMEEADRRTARLEVRMPAPGRFEAIGQLTEGFRLLLTPEMLGEKGRVEVGFDGRRKSHRAKPSAQVLLLEFVERFDRTFLPVATVDVR